MRTLEEALLDIEDALDVPPDVIMTIYEDDIPDSALPTVHERIRQLREGIGAVKQRYELDPQIISNRRRITAKLTLLSIDLSGATSRYMRAYGEVPKEDRAELDERILKLIAIVDDLNATVGRSI
jgi:ABC-type arginine transport system ATPase subunit